MYDSHAALHDFVTALVGIGGQLTTTLQHMEAFRQDGRSAPGAEPIPEVLARVLEPVLEGLMIRFTGAELVRGTMLLEDAAQRIAEELLLLG